MRNKVIIWTLVLIFAVLMSLPWLVPHTGALALIGFIPLLLADDFARELKIGHFWIFHYSAFVLWNAFTTFWVCNATVGGGIFAILANALQMSIIFGMYRFSRKRLSGALPYIFLAVMWIAWERWYLQSAQISWPWLVLGNAFAGSVRLAQWYEITGTLGGSLWIWACNLGIYAMLHCMLDRKWLGWSLAARLSFPLSVVLTLSVPVYYSFCLYNDYSEVSDGSVQVLIGQPNFDPYQKFESLTQVEQTEVLLNLFDGCGESADAGTLYIAPETFTSDVVIRDGVTESATIARFVQFLDMHPGCAMLFGASVYELVSSHSQPSVFARRVGDYWLRSRNSAMLVEQGGALDIHHKSKLVVGTESTPYPRLFVPVDNWLSARMGVGGLIGRCEGQDEVSLLKFGEVPLGCAVCYESVYGEYCTSYVRKGAQAMTVITNDAWWGDTPGYRQHFNFSRLRAIELRRDFARCGNTGISAFINQRGDVVERGPWWERATLKGRVNLSKKETPFVRFGDVCGRICTLAFLLLFALLIVRTFVPRT